jgi:excisionase family DNA binding protein
MNNFLTSKEAAERLSVSVASLRRWRREGSGPRSYRIGGRVMYRPDELDSWVEARASEPSPVGA